MGEYMGEHRSISKFFTVNVFLHSADEETWRYTLGAN